ncbi:phospholipase A [Wielerella bovis]|nr:phospholipase A [Wielerella bovis]ULJ59933.1 phospholipase A [Wielerella bovis]
MMIMKKNTLFVLTLLPFSTTIVHAETTALNDVALSCAFIKDNAKRLACFDSAYAQQLPPKQAIQTIQPASKTIDLEETFEASKEKQAPKIVFANTPQPENLADAADAYTPLSQLYDLDKNNESGIFSLREHEPTYILPVWYRTSPNYYPHTPSRGTAINDVQTEQKRLEAKLQISVKTKVMEDLFKTRSDLWVAYTQQSNWQVYNQGEKSAPFRNNDYAPEIFLTQPVKANLPFGGKLRMLGAGYVHQSNGQSRPLSRSWNRVYAMAGMEWGKLTVMPRLWARIDPNGDDDDNPDIMDYMGYGDIRLAYQLDKQHTISSTLRYNPAKNKGAVQLNYTFPIQGKLKGYIQGFHGYGESLLDYNHKQTGIGVGIMFNGWDAF